MQPHATSTLIGALVMLASLVVTIPASAQAQSAAMQDELLNYYRGEQAAAFMVGGMGVAAAGGGAYLVTRKTDFTRGLGWTWIAMGGLEAIGGAIYAYQVEAEIDHYQAALGRDPSAYRAEEIDHMEGTTSRFGYYRAAELALTLVGTGLAAYGFGAKRDLFKGIGLGIATLSLPLLVIDSFNDVRARRYLDGVKRFDLAVGASEDGMTIATRGRF
jgi:hypothetical protein